VIGHSHPAQKHANRDVGDLLQEKPYQADSKERGAVPRNTRPAHRVPRADNHRDQQDRRLKQNRNDRPKPRLDNEPIGLLVLEGPLSIEGSCNFSSRAGVELRLLSAKFIRELWRFRRQRKVEAE
jgi:hypothetical protein